MDSDAIRRLLDSAFGRRAEGELVAKLRDSSAVAPHLCLVAEEDQVVIGHIFYSYITLRTPSGDARQVLALAPMAVFPAFQNRGVGTALVVESLRRADARGESLAVVVGHAGYYPRFGFVPARSLGIEPPYPEMPDDVFMAKTLSGYTQDLKGTVEYPEAFDLVG